MNPPNDFALDSCFIVVEWTKMHTNLQCSLVYQPPREQFDLGRRVARLLLLLSIHNPSVVVKHKGVVKSGHPQYP